MVGFFAPHLVKLFIEIFLASLLSQIRQPTANMDSPGTTSGDDVESNGGDWSGVARISSSSVNHANSTSGSNQPNGTTEMFKVSITFEIFSFTTRW